MSIIEQARVRIKVTLILTVVAAVLLAGAWVYTSTAPDTSSQVTFQVTWENTAPADVRYQVGGGKWISTGDMHGIEQHHGWRSDPLPYDPQVTYRLAVVQYDRSDVTRLIIEVDGHPRAAGDNQHPTMTIPTVELRGS